MVNLKIGIVGGGELGGAVAAVLQAGPKIPVLIWDQNPRLANTASLAALVADSEVILLCVPASANREIAKRIASELNATDKLILSLSKGVETGFITMAEVLKAGLEGRANYGLIYGPILASELRDGRRGYGLVAVNNLQTKTLKQTVEVFKASRLNLWPTDQLAAIAVWGPLKNIYALALGLADGLGLGLNAKSLLTINIFAEMTQLAQKLDAPLSGTARSIAEADLLATGWCDESYNYQTGLKLAVGQTGLSSEGLNSLHQLASRLDLKPFATASLLHRIVTNKVQAKQFETLLTTPA